MAIGPRSLKSHTVPHHTEATFNSNYTGPKIMFLSHNRPMYEYPRRVCVDSVTSVLSLLEMLWAVHLLITPFILITPA